MFACLGQRLLILFLVIIAINNWVACTFVTFGGLVTDVKQLCSLSAHSAGVFSLQFLSKYIFTGMNKRCVKGIGLLLNFIHVV